MLRRLVCSLACLAQVDTARRWRLHARRLVPILSLHRVHPVANPFWSPLDPDLFDQLLAYIGRHFHVTTLSAMAMTTDRPSLILSFDDGYRDFLDYAVPLLAKHGLPANQNVIPACVESGRPPWNVAMYDFLQVAPPTLLAEMRLPGFDMPAPTADADSKMRFGLALSRFLKNRQRSERASLWAIVSEAMARFGDVPFTPMLSATEVRQLAMTHEIGAHSFDHESMGFEDMGFFEADVAACQRYFAETLQLPMRTYAFPNGSHRPEQIQYLQAQGISRVLLVGEGLAQPGTGVYRRLTIHGSSLDELKLRTVGYFGGA
ncbi:MAG: polysaccharide deacetylase family protein [Candidatus Sericytochromatia bacterium]|nr:polysaccharide deacetylase family protein [Candidatus Sericytochromatia bacterium]